MLAFLDGDDAFLPGHLERLVPAFASDPSVVLAFGDLERFKDGGADLGGNLELIRADLRRISTDFPAPGLQRLGDELRAIQVRQSMILPSSWVASRAAIDRSGLFDPALEYGEDVDFFWRLTSTGTVVWHDGATARRREHGNNASDPSRAAWSEPQLLRAAVKMQRESPDHSAVESEALDGLLNRSIWINGWLAAGQGLRHYLAWRQETSQLLGRRVPPRLKLLLRAALRG